MYVLTVLSGPDAGKSEQFGQLPIAIGRSVSDGFVLTERLAAAVHGRLFAEGASLCYEDLGSRHGTLVEDDRGVAALHAGDGPARCRLGGNTRLVIGETVLLAQDLTFAEEAATRLLDTGVAAEEPEEPTIRLTEFEPRLFSLFRLARELWHTKSVSEVLEAGADAAVEAFGTLEAAVLATFGTDAHGEMAARGLRAGDTATVAVCDRVAGALMASEAPTLDVNDGSQRRYHGLRLRGREAPTGTMVLVTRPGQTLRGSDLDVADAMGDLVAGALERLRLETDVRAMFEGIVEMCVAAVDARDPATAGHSGRVAELALALHDAWAAETGPEEAARRREMLRYAALLHDIGKIGVREAVLMKSARLEPAVRDAIRYRLEAARCAVQAGRGLVGELGRNEAVGDVAALDALELAVDTSMDGRPQPESVRAWIPRARQTWFVDSRGRKVALLTESEADSLLVERGTLTAAEWGEMQSHVDHTRRLLDRIPWPSGLREVPAVAALHHEKLDGSGYPLGVGAESLGTEARILTIADIYDAMSGADRIYRPALSPDEAAEVLRREAASGALDAELVDLFVRTVVGGDSVEARRKTG